MEKLETFEELLSKMNSFNLSDYQATICKNIKRIRKELKEENEAYYKLNNLKNPYTAPAVAELLGISYEYYKRLESFDKSKPISIKVFLKIVFLFNKDISEFLK